MIGGMDVEAMPDRGWSRAFDEPIPLPDGGELRTLLDAGRYVDALPRSTHEREGISDLRGRAHTLERHSRDQSGLSLGGAGEPVQHSGFNGSGRDCINANA
jgi:hypothetical protein